MATGLMSLLAYPLLTAKENIGSKSGKNDAYNRGTEEKSLT